MNRPRVRATFAQIGLNTLWMMKDEKQSVNKLFIECWCSAPYSRRWMSLHTELRDKTLKQAKARLRSLELFEFKSICTVVRGQRHYESWVLNLYGATAAQVSSDYQEFLNGDYWQTVRKVILERDNYTCQHCGATRNLQVHHLTYEHHGREHLFPEDLLTLCRSCHEQVHSE